MTRRFRAMRWGYQLILASFAFAQQGPVILSAGYKAPHEVRIAPGQMLTVFIQLPNARLDEEIRAPGPNLATELAGIRVTLEQRIVPGRIDSIGVPLLSVRPLPDYRLTGGLPATPIVAITGQIPFGVQRGQFSDGVFLRVHADSVPVDEVVTVIFFTQIRLLGPGCRSFLFEQALPQPPTCVGQAMFPDGQAVDGGPYGGSRRARAGDNLVLYALGLGVTEPPANTGEPAPADVLARVARFTQINLEYSFRAGPRDRSQFPPDSPNVVRIEPSYIGLAPGLIGIYQINFTLPKPPPGLPPCQSATDYNATISVAGVDSFDGAGFCVVPEG